eukprot:9161145-Pyramimonas_sp.AAC.1
MLRTRHCRARVVTPYRRDEAHGEVPEDFANRSRSRLTPLQAHSRAVIRRESARSITARLCACSGVRRERDLLGEIF